jgi:hypothetical protein
MERLSWKPGDYLSPSGLNTLLSCGAKFAYRYEERIKFPPNGNLLRGQAVDEAMSFALEAKRDGETPATDQIGGFAEAQLQMKSPSGDWEGDDYGPEESRAVVTRMAECWATELLPRIIPKEVQPRYRPEFDGIRLEAQFDYVTSTGAICDGKTTYKSISKPKPDHITQITFYAAARAVAEGRDPVDETTWLHYIVHANNKTGLKVEAVPLEVPATATAQQFILRTVERAAKLIKAKAYVPNPNGMMCSEKYCDYWDRCRGGES